MAHGLGLKSIAEGIETAEQQVLLKHLGCDYSQSYYFSKALRADGFQDYVRGIGGTRRSTITHYHAKCCVYAWLKSEQLAHLQGVQTSDLPRKSQVVREALPK